MSEDSGLFRVYDCKSCGNIGVVEVKDKAEETKCSFCSGTISDMRSSYAQSKEEAMEKVKALSPSGQVHPKTFIPSESLGVRKRILRIIDSLVGADGLPSAPKDLVVRECTEAGIALSKTSTILQRLLEEGVVSESFGGYVKVGGPIK